MKVLWSTRNPSISFGKCKWVAHVTIEFIKLPFTTSIHHRFSVKSFQLHAFAAYPEVIRFTANVLMLFLLPVWTCAIDYDNRAPLYKEL